MCRSGDLAAGLLNFVLAMVSVLRKRQTKNADACGRNVVDALPSVKAPTTVRGGAPVGGMCGHKHGHSSG